MFDNMDEAIDKFLGDADTFAKLSSEFKNSTDNPNFNAEIISPVLKVSKHIPVTSYEEITPFDSVDDWENKALVITNIGGKLYKKTII